MVDVAIRDWTFTHWWVRPTVKVWFDFYHKSVTYSGVDHINWQKPIIFAPSHQNAFTDALCLILPTKYTNDRFIYPLIRADAFGNNKALDWMLTVFHMLPVYRPRDNVDLKQQNQSVFSHCHEILYKNRNLLIHPEGNCIPRKRVRRFKKGLARIALGAEANKSFELGVNVIPVGINYRAITEARKGIHVQYSKPISVSAYKDQYADSAASAITDLTREVERGVRKVTLDFDTSDYQFTQQVVRLLKNSNPSLSATTEYDLEELKFEQQIADRLKEAEQEDPALSESLQPLLRKGNAVFEKYNLNKELPAAESKSTTGLFLEGVGYLMLLPIFIYGSLNNILPWFLMNWVGDKVQEKQFVNSARMVSGLIIFPLMYLLQTAAFGMVAGAGSPLLVYLISLPITGILSLNISENGRQWLQQFRLKKMRSQDQQTLSKLLDKLTDKVRATTNSADSA